MSELIRLDVSRAGLCGSRFPQAPTTKDSICQHTGAIVQGTVVDHIIPATGPNDPLFFVPTAHQLLCESCHNAKRQRESRT